MKREAVGGMLRARMLQLQGIQYKYGVYDV